MPRFFSLIGRPSFSGTLPWPRRDVRFIAPLPVAWSLCCNIVKETKPAAEWFRQSLQFLHYFVNFVLYPAEPPSLNSLNSLNSRSASMPQCLCGASRPMRTPPGSGASPRPQPQQPQQPICLVFSVIGLDAHNPAASRLGTLRLTGFHDCDPSSLSHTLDARRALSSTCLLYTSPSPRDS